MKIFNINKMISFYFLQWIEEPAVLVTRFEYANMFHTVTDWYSAYVASRVTGLPIRPHLVFVDGHCEVCCLDFFNFFSTHCAIFCCITY